MTTPVSAEPSRFANFRPPRKWFVLAAVWVVVLSCFMVVAVGMGLSFAVQVVAEHMPVRGTNRLKQLGAIVQPHFLDGRVLVEVIITNQWTGTDADMLLIGQVSNVVQVSIERDLSDAALRNLGYITTLRYVDASALAPETKAAKKRLLHQVCPNIVVHDTDERARQLIYSD